MQLNELQLHILNYHNIRQQYTNAKPALKMVIQKNETISRLHFQAD